MRALVEVRAWASDFVLKLNDLCCEQVTYKDAKVDVRGDEQAEKLLLNDERPLTHHVYDVRKAEKLLLNDERPRTQHVYDVPKAEKLLLNGERPLTQHVFDVPKNTRNVEEIMDFTHYEEPPIPIVGAEPEVTDRPIRGKTAKRPRATSKGRVHNQAEGAQAPARDDTSSLSPRTSVCTASDAGGGKEDAHSQSSTTDTSKQRHRRSSDEQVHLQRSLGPQSKRGLAPQFQLQALEGSAHYPHYKACFDMLERNEAENCEDWAVFYHSYSHAALIYELQAAAAALLFGFDSKVSTLPRLLAGDFKKTPTAEALMKKFEAKFASDQCDHHPEYRAVAMSVMCSLVALGPEASPPVVFTAGYSQLDMSFKNVLENLLKALCVPSSVINKVAAQIIEASERHGLDVSQFGGKACVSGRAGHLLQIFVLRPYVDDLVYASQPWGVPDAERQPISAWVDDDTNMNWGQARIVANPHFFLQASFVRMRVISADPAFHANRAEFQGELIQLLRGALSSKSERLRSVNAVFDGAVPKWIAGVVREKLEDIA